MTRVVALVDDLFFQTKMLETARHIGVELECVTSAAALVERTRKDRPALVVIDLNAKCGGIEALHELAPGNQLRVIGFLSHVQAELAERAKSAGCEDVMPRSKFTQDLAKIFLRAKAKDLGGTEGKVSPDETL